MAKLTALLDSSALYPAPMRDFLMHLAAAELFRARWTHAIHNEWISALLRDRSDLTRARLERTAELMNTAVLECLVEGYERLIDDLTLPDPNDRHVLAAAISCGADVIVTANLRDFPTGLLAEHAIEPQSPDEFVMGLIELAPLDVCAAARAHRTNLHNPPKSVDEFLETLRRQQLGETVRALTPFKAEL